MFGGSGGIVVVSSCLDGPRVHRPADSAWMEARVDSRQATGAGTTKLAATDVPGGARPGRITVRAALARGARSSGRAAPDARLVCYSLRIRKEDRTELVRGGLSGNPAPRERAERGWSAMQEGSGLLHPQVRQESGDRGSWSERERLFSMAVCSPF